MGNSELRIKKMKTPRCELTSFSFDELVKLDPTSDEFIAAGKTVAAEFREVGFLRMVDIGDFDDSAFLNQLKWFHGQEWDEKMRIALNRFEPKNENAYRGYMPLVDNVSVYKEQTDFGNDSLAPSNEPLKNFMHEKSQYPSDEFEAQIKKIYKMYTKVAQLMMQLCAVGLGLEADYFGQMHTDAHLSTLRTLHYPPKDAENPRGLDDEKQIISTPAHVDTSMLTLLCTFDNYGLQVLNKNNEWTWVIPKRDTLIVNLGVIMQNMTNGELCATKHRVIDLGQDRYPVPMFVEPHFDDVKYATNIRTETIWTGQTKPLAYGVYNIMHGGRHAEYSEITRDPRIDLVREHVPDAAADESLRLFQLNGDEK